MSPMIHYLGLVLDGRWEFSEHFAVLVSKVSRMVDALTRLMLNLDDLDSLMRKMYADVIMHTIRRLRV